MAIALRETGAALFSAADMSPVIPTSQVTGDMMLLIVGGKPYNSVLSVSTTGWASLSRFEDGTTAAGVDTGSMFVAAWWKVATSDTETNPTITEGATVWNVVGAYVMVFSKDAGETWETPLMTGGGDATAGTGFSVTCATNPVNVTGDLAVSWGAFHSDAATPCTSHIVATQTNTTFTNTHTPATDPETVTGGDMGMCSNVATVSGAGGVGAPIISATLGGVHTGSAGFIRLRAAAAAATLPPKSLVQSGAVSRSYTR